MNEMKKVTTSIAGEGERNQKHDENTFVWNLTSDFARVETFRRTIVPEVHIQNLIPYARASLKSINLLRNIILRRSRFEFQVRSLAKYSVPTVFHLSYRA